MTAGKRFTTATFECPRERVVLVADEVASPVEHRLDDRTLNSIHSARYWNDLGGERTQEWWIADGGDSAYARLRSYLEESGLIEDFEIAKSCGAGRSRGMSELAWD